MAKKKDEEEAKVEKVVEKPKAKAEPKAKKAAPKAKAAAKKKAPVKDLKDLAEAVATAEADPVEEAPVEEEKAEAEEAVVVEPEARKPKLDAQGRAYATGRRKDAVARVWIRPGKGSVVVNGRDQVTYFARQTQRLVLNQPFLIVNRMGQFDVMCTVKGGGLSGQAGAVRHGISRALENFDPEMRPTLKKAGMLTRDSRIVERKKIGKHKARRSKQWAKR